MKHEQLIGGLKDLRLYAMACSYAEHARAAENAKQTYEQYLANLVTDELLQKHDKKVKRLLRDSKFPVMKDLDSYDFKNRSGVNEVQIRRLAKGDFIRDGGNVVFYGSFGVGKSHLATALSRELCLVGYRCRYYSTCGLINDLLEAQKNLTLANLFKRLDRYDVLICDELGYTPQSREGADLFFQLISQRYERKSMIFTTNLTFSEWDKVFLNAATTAAAVDRIIHNCETFNISGESWRAQTAKKRKSNNKSLK